MNFSREIIERRILPALGVYIGASWVVVEILDRLVERYFLSPYITDIVFWGLFTLLPAVTLLAWVHGRPGKDRVTRAEKIVIPLNLLFTATLLLTVFSDKDIGVTADLVTVANELGQEEAHYVPRDSYRRRIAVFFWDAEEDSEPPGWLQYGITELLTQDLQQNPFILATSPWENQNQGLYAGMKQAGFDDALGIPLALKREIADDANRDFFIDGSVALAEERYTVTARVWETSSLEMLGEIRAEGWDLLKAVDELASDVSELLDTPKGSGDMPLVETFGESEQALQYYIQARNAVLFENDRDKANDYYDRALHMDPDFVLAWFMKSVSMWEQSDAVGAQQALEQAQRLSYRLPERDRVAVKSIAYQMAGEHEKVETLLRMQTQIEGDGASYGTLARYLMFTGRLDEAKELYKRQMELDSSAIDSFLQLARLEQTTGDIDAAIAYGLEYVAARPEDLEPNILLGDLYLESGDLDAAENYYERGQILEDPPLVSTLRLALLSIRQGDWNQARELLTQARVAAVTESHALMVLRIEAYLETRLGRIDKAMDLVEQQLPISRRSETPVQVVFAYNVPMIEHNISLGRLDVAESALLAASEAINPPLNQFLSFTEVVLEARKGDFEAAAQALETGVAAIEHFKADYLAFLVPLTEAVIAELSDEYSRAGRLYRDAIRQARRSVVANTVQNGYSVLYGACAQMHVRAGELELAQGVLDHAFRLDNAEPSLWVARAMLQDAYDTPHLALASINYALAIWADADTDYLKYREALDLKETLETAAR